MTLLRTRCEALANEACYGQYIACDLKNNACVKPECPLLNLENGWFDGNENKHGSRKRINCYQGHLEVNGTTITTCINGEWTPKPICIVNECPALTLKNGRLDGNEITNGSQKRIYCNQRHVEVNQTLITTCINREWTPKPKCIVNDWRLFIGVPEIGGDILDSWKNGTKSTTELDKCFDENAPNCTKHFRDPFVDRWRTIGVQKVKVSLHKNRTLAAYVLFNATGQDMNSWFDKSMIINSSWNLSALSKMEVFSMEGALLRRFLISEQPVSTCNETIVMMALAEKEYGCAFARFGSYPRYMYSTLSGGAIPAQRSGDIFSEIDLADTFVIEVYYDENEESNAG
ncbi:uncharacterized protein LOC127855759 [Dreissena polymorpha]|uniref:uncharacterized protein LOC127855759 n=1 Tax=Dreissena polymorpha TaxID=45954 RepID=UPI002264C9D8|nr:uncharacterized protein LOC127855759 [Dreissena polymorpha]